VINTELEAARRQIAYAAGWSPAARSLAEMDRFFVAIEPSGLGCSDGHAPGGREP
jgi:hypothetical protein